MTARKVSAPELHTGFVSVVRALVRDDQVSYGDGKGFGSRSLKVNGRIFAMMSSNGEFVVKLPNKRVNQLVTSGLGQYFTPRKGRPMKEWAVVGLGEADWIEIATEARDFVKRGIP